MTCEGKEPAEPQPKYTETPMICFVKKNCLGTPAE